MGGGGVGWGGEIERIRERQREIGGGGDRENKGETERNGGWGGGR